MSEYHKIQTVYKRDPETKYKTLLEGEFSLPELEYLAGNDWLWDEKIDGTNIRVEFDGEEVAFKGRTDRAQIPPFLLSVLEELFPVSRFFDAFEAPVVLYGEGYGPKIQKGGGRYRDDPSFVLFDVNVDGWWLDRMNVVDVAKNFYIDWAPALGRGSLHEMVEQAKAGIKSAWGDFEAEGIVARPATELRARSGHRIITKVKCKDFPK